MAPVVEQAAKEVAGKAKVFEIDIDKNQDTPTQFGIMSIPALLIFKGGKEVGRLGIAKKDQIVKAIEAISN